MYNFHKTYIKACNSKIKGQLYELRGLREARERSGTPGSYSIATVGDGDLGVWGVQGWVLGCQDQARSETAAGRTDGRSPAPHPVPAPWDPTLQTEPAFFPPLQKVKEKGKLATGKPNKPKSLECNGDVSG